MFELIVFNAHLLELKVTPGFIKSRGNYQLYNY